MKFKIGDKVRVIDQTNGWGRVKKGDIGNIVKHAHDNTWVVKFPEDSCWYGKEKCFELVEEKENPNQTKYQFKEGDGMIWKTSTKEQREEITHLLKEKGYQLYNNYINTVYNNPFTNNFRFNSKGKWVTSSVTQVTNPLTFEEMKNLILGNVEPQYEIY